MTENNGKPPSIGQKILDMNPKLVLDVLEEQISSKKRQITDLLNTGGTRKEDVGRMSFDVFWEKFLKIMVELYSKREEKLRSGVPIAGIKFNRRDFLHMTAGAAIGGGTLASVALAGKLWESMTKPNETKIDISNLTQAEIAKAASDHARNVLYVMGVGGAIGGLVGAGLTMAQILNRDPKDLNTPKEKMSDLIELPETRNLIVEMYDAGLGMLEPMKVFELALELHFLEMKLAELNKK